MKKNVQTMKVEIDSLKKAQTEVNLKRKKSERSIKSSNVSLTNRVQLMEEP